MLFDLRGSGRRTTVKVVYLSLGVLMGVGLVLFGIGGSVSGGLVDAITGSSGTSSSVESYRKRAVQAEAKARATPTDAAAWAAAARARYQLASAGDFFDQAQGTFTEPGKQQLRLATADWEKHLALDPNPPDDSVAGMMVKAYSQFGLNEPAKAVTAQEVITEVRPKAATFATLAILSYQAGQTRKGDLASKKALSLADPADRETLKADLDAEKQQSLSQQIQNATPSPTATAAPKAGAKKKKKDSSGR
jgi:hypothetical protein